MSRPKGYKWVCPRCKRGITLYVKVSEPPTCNNRDVHALSTIKMETKGEKK